MNKKIVIGVALGVALLGMYVSPYVAASNMENAVYEKEPDKLLSYIDMPVLKDNLKGKMRDQLATEAAKSKPGSLEMLGYVMSDAMISSSIDALLSPTSIRMIVADAPDDKKLSDEDDVKVSTHYASLNVFNIVVESIKKPEQTATFSLHRDGLFGWKVSDMDIPL